MTHRTARKSPQEPDSSRKIGLARALSKLGYCSRQQAAKLIRQGKVRLNGSAPKNPETPVRLGTDRIEVQGHALKAAEKGRDDGLTARSFSNMMSDRAKRPSIEKKRGVKAT